MEGKEEEPSTRVMLGFEARRLADGEEASLVRARTWKGGGEMPESAVMRLPPCLPVAPTTRSFRVAILRRVGNGDENLELDFEAFDSKIW